MHGFLETLFVLLFLLLGAPLCTAASPEGHQPQLCSGFGSISGSPSWGFVEGACPPHHVLLAVDPAGPSDEDTGYRIPAAAICCPLPASDVLLDDQVLVDDQCPDDTVATGSYYRFNSDTFRQRLICTGINTARYQLGPATPGAYWGYGYAAWKHEVQYSRWQLPLALRYAAGRKAKFRWMPQGCVGRPYGAILTGKRTKRCHGFTFKELQFRGLTNDPPQGTPVQMFPECRRIEDIFAETFRCIR